MAVIETTSEQTSFPAAYAELPPDVAFIAATREDDKVFNDKLIKILEGLGCRTIQLAYPEINDQIEELKKCKVIILGGVPADIEEKDNEGCRPRYDADHAETLATYIKPLLKLEKEEDDLVFLGICAGHQSVGSTFGLMVEREIEIEEGPTELEIIKEDRVFAGIERPIKIHASHWASLEKIPEGSQIENLARSVGKLMVSTGCENAVIKIKGRNIYGFQFHPEDSGVAGIMLIYNILKIAGLKPTVNMEELLEISNQTH